MNVSNFVTQYCYTDILCSAHTNKMGISFQINSLTLGKGILINCPSSNSALHMLPPPPPQG